MTDLSIHTIKHVACSITSSLFCIFYLLALTTCALISALLSDSKDKDRSISLSRDEKKLTFDLGYYIRLAGLDIEHHPVSTSDGFGLDMVRIVSPTHTHHPNQDQYESQSGANAGLKPKYPVLLIPGLMQASAAYCTAGPNAIAITLAKAGYDVWLGNNRCGFDLSHLKYKYPWRSGMWEWSMHELATIDVPTMINHVKAVTGAPKIAIGAHSQGTTQCFIGLSKAQGLPDMGNCVSSFSALAPAVYAGPLIDRWFLKMLRVPIGLYRTMIGYRAFLGIMGVMRKLIPLRMFTFFAYIMFSYMLGWTDTLWDRHYRDRDFIFAPVYVSSKLMFWWLGEGGFADRKCVFDSENGQWFDERFPNLAMFTCGRDNLVLPEQLINRLKTREPELKHLSIYDLPGYSHLDVLWAADADQQVALPMAKFIWDNVEDRGRWREPELP